MHTKRIGLKWRAGIAWLLATLGMSTAGAQIATTQADASYSGGNRWVATWGGAPIPPGETTTIDALFANNHSQSFDNQTIRNIAHVSVGGRRVRVRISNAFGMLPLRVGSAHAALSRGGATINTATGRRLTFGGQASVLIPAGAVVISDPVDINVPTSSDMAVSVYLPGQTEPATFNETKMQTSYVAPAGSGNLVNAADLPSAAPTRSTFYVTVIEVQASENVGALVAFGDSVTLGAGSTPELNRSWPDQLSARLNTYRPRLSVVNQGIGCNRLLFDMCGQSGAARFDRDVLGVAGVSHVIVAFGINDLMIPSILPNFGYPEFASETVSSAEIIFGLQQIIQRARAAGVKVYGATITPNGSSLAPGAHTPDTEAKRNAVNRWIRTSGAFDGVVDFDAAVRDPSNPARLRDIYDADGVHLTDEGYAAMANAINLSMFF
jgi:lysophospholipase L1-like esterase